jgi:beta-lactamase superfamily II metal-dependent hydrolase
VTPIRRASGRALTWLAAVLASMPVAGWAVSVDAQEPFVEITFLDVGQGDAVVVRAPGGRTAMIDAGRVEPLRLLQRMGIEEIDLLVATHPHADHIGGLDAVLTTRPVRYFMDNGRPHTTETYRQLMATLERLSDVGYLEAMPRTVSLGSVTLEVLPLPPGDVDHNDRSIGLILRFGDFSAFLSGDSERTQLTHWTRAGAVPKVTLLKAPHHGAANGFTRDFLEDARPEVVVISVGADNPYLHPRPSALSAYRSIADHVLRTDRDGHVTVLGYADGRYDILHGRELATRERVTSGRASASTPSDSVARSGSFTTASPAAAFSLTVFPDAPGDDHRNLNGEHVTIENHGEEAVDIGRWLLCDLSSRCFRFPDEARLEARRRVVVYTGYGMSDGVSFFMNNSRAVWNHDGDEASLFDAHGNRVLRHVYE